MRRISALFVLLSLCLLAADPPPAPPPTFEPRPEGPSVTFKSEVSMARVDAQVVDAENRPIRGLRAEDFVLRDNGRQQEIRAFQAEDMPLDVLLLLDVSRSMEPHVRRIASASHQALRALRGQDRIAIMVFDGSTRVRMRFGANRDAERELERVLDQETFDGGTDITRGLLDAAGYMAQNARRDARRAIVILTDDQTERNRDVPGVSRALARAECVLSSLIAPDALQTSSARRPPLLDDRRLRDLFGGMIPPGFGSIGGIGLGTQAAGVARIARESGGDSMAVEDVSAFESTLARIRERYALFFYLPEGARLGDQRSVAVELSDDARRRYPGAHVRYRQSHAAEGSSESDDSRPVRVSLPPTGAPGGPRAV